MGSDGMTDDEILVYLFDAIKNPEGVNFAQVLNDRRVKECRVKYNNDKWNMVYETVELFAFGTWEDYVRGRKNGKYLVLDELCTMNLKVLSLMTARKELNTGEIPYDLLYEKLGVEHGNTWELEQIVIGATQRGLMSGYVDQEKQTVFIRNILTRDVRLSDAEQLAEKAKSWCEKIQNKLDKMRKAEFDADQKDLAKFNANEDHIYKLDKTFQYVKLQMIAQAGGSGSSSNQPRPKKTKVKPTNMMTT